MNIKSESINPDFDLDSSIVKEESIIQEQKGEVCTENNKQNE